MCIYTLAPTLSLEMRKPQKKKKESQSSKMSWVFFFFFFSSVNQLPVSKCAFSTRAMMKIKVRRSSSLMEVITLIFHFGMGPNTAYRILINIFLVAGTVI